MLSVENLSKSYGGHELFNSASFRINSRERVGLVGRNGHGKTTLFRLLTGAAYPDDGTITLPKNYRIGHVQQQIEFTEDTIVKEGMKGLCAADRDQHWKVEKILNGLGFTQADMEKHPNVFSGGFQVRLNLAKVLVSEPDLLLLDEPTNYLDITSIRWVVRFLNRWPHELMLITHDRGFMDSIVTHTVGIHRGKIKKFSGNTEKYYSQIAMEEEVYEKTRINDEKKRKEVELFINRFRAKARLANLVQSRLKTLAKMEKKEKLESMKTLDFSFRSKPFAGKFIGTIEDLSFAYERHRPLITKLSVAVGYRERICIIGKNGKGKTTLLKLLSGALSPMAGTVTYNPNAVMGVFEQSHLKTLVDENTVEEEIQYSHPDVDKQAARNICGAMMFSGDDALKKVSVLSGGEKSRVMLGKLLATPVNLLLLDEPTNHLDMESCDALLAAIDHFDGAVIMVTHNEMFLHALADRLIVFKDNRQVVFEGNYQRFLDQGGWDDTLERPRGQRSATDSVGHPPPVSKKEIRRRRSEIIAEKGRHIKPLEDKIKNVEQQIETSEEEIEQLNQELVEASNTGEGDRIAELSKQLNVIQKQVDACYDSLESLTESLERAEETYSRKLALYDA